jgi:hypothetical protein
MDASSAATSEEPTPEQEGGVHYLGKPVMINRIHFKMWLPSDCNEIDWEPGEKECQSKPKTKRKLSSSFMSRNDDWKQRPPALKKTEQSKSW